ncbi:MAG: OmpA family protein [Bacteroidia bacterium]|nr:OmpA family protein [Bacteroidia bacterium]
MKKLSLLILGFIVLTAFAFKPETKFLKKAVQSLEKGNLKNAKAYYMRALAKNPDSYDANLGIGLMMCELLDEHTKALPYLEKALALSKKDTIKDLAFALAQCYQYNSEFEKAIHFYSMLDGCVDFDNEIDLTHEIQKRKDDCAYAIEHKYAPKNPTIFLINAGKGINTEMPEYVPVLTPDNELIFTSKRKDTRKEELNYMDGKYYESMYISKMDSLGFKKVRRYTLPDFYMRSHFAKFHESIISISPDGKKLFTFRDNKIFEININDRSRFKPKKLLRTINFNYYQNHAFVSRDGNTLYFTSDAIGGYGGNDIYQSIKDSKGQWGKPKNLGPTVNTSFDEESPFISEDGRTLFFSSTGHEGFGNFDIYKTTYLDTAWTKPENLGEPINSPGHDIFMITDSIHSVGYMSSSRNGGFGDMDIYKIIYLDKINRNCPSYNTAPMALTITDEQGGDFKNKIEVAVPSNYKVLSYEWRVNDVVKDSSSAILDYDYLIEGNYKISAKVVAICDTCLMPIVSCNYTDNELKKPVLIVEPPASVFTDVSTLKGELSNEQLMAIGFNLNPVLFDFNKTDLRGDALEILAANIELLKKNPELKVKIYGHTDVRGSETNNRRISEARAKEVRNCLLKNGVKKSQIVTVKGKGAKELLNNCGNGQTCDEAAHQQNRRVVFSVSKD